MPSTLGIPVYYDFASTICYVAHRVAARIAAGLAELDVVLEWRPIDLSTITGWPRGVAVDGPRRANALRVARELGVAVRMPPCWLDSRRVHAVAAEVAGTVQEPAWRERVWTAVFEEGRSVTAESDVLPLLADLRLDPERIDWRRGAERLEEETERARRRGVNGVPTFMLDEWPMGGIQEDATMVAILGNFVRRRREK